MQRLFTISLAVIMGAIPSSLAYAQYGGVGDAGGSSDSGAANALVLVVTPENPRPNREVSVEVKTTFFDLDRAEIAWLENKKLSESGIGRKTHTVLLGKSGSATTVTVVVKSDANTIYENSITLRPAAVDLIWEAVTLVPPFYQGKALYSEGSSVNIIAMPEIIDADGSKIAAKNLLYTWRKDSTVLGNLSGFGKNVLKISEPILRTPFTIGVTASTRDGRLSAEGSILLDTTEPQVVLYEDHPLYGLLYNRALGREFAMTARELVVSAFPYFFRDPNRSLLTYRWNINGVASEQFQGPSITLRNESGQKGSASVYLDVASKASYLQGGSAGVTINFGGN